MRWNRLCASCIGLLLNLLLIKYQTLFIAVFRRYRGRHEWTLQQDGAPSHIAWSSIVYLRRENVASIQPDICRNKADLNRVDYAIWGTCRSESTKAGILPPLIDWSRRSCWSEAHCHGASLITTSDNRRTSLVCSVLWNTMADILNTRFTNSVYCKIIVVKDVLKIFSAVDPTARLSCKSFSLLIYSTCWFDTRGAL